MANTHMMKIPDELLSAIWGDSDISPGSLVFTDIDQMLHQLDINIVGWNFKSKLNSYAGRNTEDGNNKPCPSLRIFLRNADDFAEEGINIENGNRDDGWVRTHTIRNNLNKILNRHKFNSDYISDQCFVFVQDAEDMVMDFLGRQMKSEVIRMIERILKPRKTGLFSNRVIKPPRDVYWSSARIYSLLFENKRNCYAARIYQPILSARATAILKYADKHKFCRNHNVKISFYYSGMKNLPPLYRED